MRLPTIILAAAVLLTGCEKKTGAQRESPEKAERLAKLGEYKPAIRAYEAALDGSVKTADLHYKIALIYDDKLKSPLNAIHHYDRYLDLAPSGQHVADARNARKECEKSHQTSVNNEGLITQSAAVKLRRDLGLLQTINSEQKAEIVRLQKLLKENKIEHEDPKRIEAQAAKGPPPPGSRKHTVKTGDTLGKIAELHYKNRGLAGHIKDANQFQLKGTDKLKIGQVLIIPEAPKR